MRRSIVIVVLLAIKSVATGAGVAAPCDYGGDYYCGEYASGNYSCQIGEVAGVPAYSNGDWTGNADGCGRWQCVEYAQRFYAQEVQHPLGSCGTAGNAFGTWGGTDPGDLLQCHDGQETTPPASGDIYCQAGGGAGHVGIIKSVDVNAGTVVIVDQNRSPTNAELVRALYRDGEGRYSIQSIGINYTTQGWLRDPGYSPSPPTYACQLKAGSQSPSGTIPKHPGQTFTCTVQYWNRGNTTWDKVPPNGYIELKAVKQDGSLEPNSFLYDGSWLNGESPCTMQEASVAPNQAATFQFTGHVPADASPGMHYAWFRPNHSDATPSLLSDWGGLSFNINVVIQPPTEPGPAVDALVMDWVTGDLHVGLNANSLFDPDGYWETGWIHGTSADDFRLFTSGSNADVYQDLCALSVRLGNWDELTTNGYDFYTHRQLLSNWKAYTGGDQKHQYFMADATGDGKPDAIHVATHTGVASVARRSGSALVPDANVWITSFRNGALNTHQFFAGDVTGDGKADLLAREVSTGNWYLAKSTGSTFSTSGVSNPVLTAWTADALTNLKFQILLADIDADGRDELIAYRPEVGSVSWCDWNGTSFTKMGTLTSNWGVSSEPYRYRLLSGDLNKDWKEDLVLFKADGGNWYGGLSTGTSLTDRHTWRSDFGNSTDQTRYRPYLFDVGTTGSYRLPVDTLGTAVQAPGPLVFRVVPNPAREAIELWFDRPQTAVASLQVFDLQGRLVRSITDPASLEGNPLWWDGRNGQDERVPAGIYFLRITTPNQSLTRRVTVIR